jgi:hypothetical protein
MPRHTDHMGLVITTSSATAAARYADGVELLISSSDQAMAVLRAAVAADASLGIAGAALAWCAAGQAGADPTPLDAAELPMAPARATRRERQHIEIIGTALRGDGERARALGAEHLREFPNDVLIAHLVGR